MSTHNIQSKNLEQASNVVHAALEGEQQQVDDDKMPKNIEEEHSRTSNAKKRKRVHKRRSIYWDSFDAVKVFEGDPPVEVLKGKCRACKTLIAADSKKNGTTALKNHTISCSRKQAQLDDQSILNLKASDNGMGSLTSWRFEQKAGRRSLCKMILLDEIPFRFVEHEGFKNFVADICPQFKIPSRKTVKEEIRRSKNIGWNLMF